MNRKNLTAAVLAGLAGVAGLAGTAQAVNLNPDGVGQVLLYPYYSANDGNATLLSVVNTTDSAKAVKVRFLEGFNSREVLDFNLYLSHHDVWVATIAPAMGATNPVEGWETDTALIIPDDSCTVPYLYEDTQIELPSGIKAGYQRFLNVAYTGDFDDGGPQTDGRAAEGHFEIIEMGTITAGSDTEEDITHAADKDDNWGPGDCDQLVENWTDYVGSGPDGIWFAESRLNDDEEDCFDDDTDVFTGCGQATTDTERNSGGLFGGAAVINPGHGAMFSYDAKAVQGFDKTVDGIHYIPGTIHPSLNDGSETDAYVFFGVPQNEVAKLQYDFTVDAVSAVFMHEFVMNEYTTADIPAEAATEWVVTFPTKNFYVDKIHLIAEQETNYRPSLSEGLKGEPLATCNLWEPGDDYPTINESTGNTINDDCGPADNGSECGPFEDNGENWNECIYVAQNFTLDIDDARAPFTELYGADDCELVGLQTWDRDERTFSEERSGVRPPVVSPAPPQGCNPNIEFCEDVIFELCNEVNVLRFGDRSVFGTPEDVDGDSLLLTVEDEFTDGWGAIDFYLDDDHVDSRGLVGLPVTGFAAYQFENDYVEGDDGTVKAFYGGLYQHKANVRRVDVDD